MSRPLIYTEKETSENQQVIKKKLFLFYILLGKSTCQSLNGSYLNHENEPKA